MGFMYLPRVHQGGPATGHVDPWFFFVPEQMLN